jgi:hypothetical protein
MKLLVITPNRAKNDTNSKRKRGPQAIPSLALRVSILVLLLVALPLVAAAQNQPVFSPTYSSMAANAGNAGETFAAAEPNPLPNLPRPPEQPASLFQPPPSGATYGCPDLECPYLQPDPRLDCVGPSRPGWLFDVELDYLGSHVFDHVGQFAMPTAVPVPFAVSVPMARLDWTASPRFELGYRLPSGFGEFDFSYRFLLASGSGTTDDPIAAPAAPAALLSHLQLRVADFDYANHETSLETMLGPGYGMKWRIGLRTADAIFDSRADEPLAAAALPAGSGFFERSISDHFWGIGPHAAVELSRRWESTGLGVVFRLDSGILFGQVTQKFGELSTVPGGSASYEFNNLQQVPMLSGFLGLDWRPACLPNLEFQAGYRGEYWWNVGRMSNPDLYNGQTAGEFGLNGAVFRLQYNY